MSHYPVKPWDMVEEEIDRLNTQITALKAERDKLRAALEETPELIECIARAIAAYEYDVEKYPNEWKCPDYSDMARAVIVALARRALEEVGRGDKVGHG